MPDLSTTGISVHRTTDVSDVLNVSAGSDHSADSLTSLALLNCLLREVAGPQGGVRAAGRNLLISLPSSGRTLRAMLSRRSLGEPRPTGQVERWDDTRGWLPLPWYDFAALVADELAGPDGEHNPRLLAEVAASHAFISAIRQRRALTNSAPDSGPASDRWTEYLTSEQSLIAGHRFHPAPKARSGSLTEALAYAPENGVEFRLRYLAVASELIRQHEAEPGAASVFDRPNPAAPPPPSDRRLLPVHPWQYRILLQNRSFRQALATGRMLDLGEIGDPVRPTSSVRTVARVDGSGFFKLSLAVQITNCLRTNPPHEIHAAVAVSRILEPIRANLSTLFPGTIILAESSSRTVNLGSSDLDGTIADGLGVIDRESLIDRLPPDVRPLLAAALVEPDPDPTVAALLRSVTADRDGLIHWWDCYLERLLSPVLQAFLAHGLVFEAHLQNVVIGISNVGPDLSQPTHLVLRDLEGVKLVGRRNAAHLAALPPLVRQHLGYSAELGWDRVAYCLFINHISSLLGLLADRDPAAERRLWSRVRLALNAFRRDHGDAPQLRNILAGLPLPAKANLLTRWNRSADRDSGYVPVSLPLGPSIATPGEPLGEAFTHKP